MAKLCRGKPVSLSIRDSVGMRIRNKRLEKSMAQWKLANCCYMSATTISKIEQDAKSPSIDDLCAIARELNVKLIDLIPEDMLRGIS